MEKQSIDVLQSEHRRLDNELHQEYGKRPPDDVRIADLKRHKLRLKDQIANVADSA